MFSLHNICLFSMIVKIFYHDYDYEFDHDLNNNKITTKIKKFNRKLC